MGEPRISNKDRIEMLQDYCKHLATLCTGAILIMATFLSNFQGQPLSQDHGSAAVYFFMMALISALLSQGLSIVFNPKGRWGTVLISAVFGFALLATMVFFGGVMRLGIFTADNMSRPDLTRVIDSSSVDN